MDITGVLQHLEGAQLIRLGDESDRTGTFRHVLIQESAYDSLLRPERRRLHQEVGETLEQSFAGRLDDISDVLAKHFDEGGEAPKALHLYARAGDLASRRSANNEAAMLYGRALELAWATEADDDAVADLGSKKGRALELAGRYAEALAAYDEMIETGARRETWKVELTALIASASIRTVPTEVFDPAHAAELAERALHLARTHGDQAGESKALWTLMMFYANTDPARSVELGEASLHLARSLGLEEQVAFTLNDISSSYLTAGRMNEAHQALEEARGYWTSLDNLPMLADNLISMSTLEVIAGRLEEGIRWAQEGLALAERTENLWGQAYARMSLSLVFFLRGEMGPALTCLRECLRLAEPAGFLDPQITMRSLYGACLGILGDIPAGLAEIARARELAGNEMRRWIGHVLASHAWLLTMSGDASGAQALLDELRALAGSEGQVIAETSFIGAFVSLDCALLQGDADRALSLTDEYEAMLSRFQMQGYQASIEGYRGLAHLARGDLKASEQHLKLALDVMEREGFGFSRWRVVAALGEVSSQNGLTSQALEYHREAARLLETMARAVPDERLRDLFRQRADVARILKSAA
jgi:tetratricopeptide (TPR) repeat protein